MILIFLSLYTAYFTSNSDSLFISNFCIEKETYIFDFDNERIQKQVYYPGDGSGIFYFSTREESAQNYYAYSIPEEKLTHIHRFELKMPEHYFTYKDKKIIPNKEIVPFNDTIDIIGGSSISGWGSYILFIKRKNSKIIKLVETPFSAGGPQTLELSKQNKLLAFTTGSYSDGYQICILNTKNDSIDMIMDGYKYPEMWKNESLLIFSDESDFIKRRNSINPREDTTKLYYTLDYKTYNLKTGEVKMLANDVRAEYMYFKGDKPRFVGVNQEKYDSAAILIRNGRNKILEKGLFQINSLFYIYFIPYPEDTLP